MIQRMVFVILCAGWILVGCKTVDATQPTIIVKVKKDDTLNSIAKENGTDWKSIVALNRSQLAKGLQEGQELRVPQTSKVKADEPVTESPEIVVNDQGEDEDMSFLPKRKKGLLYGPSSKEPGDLIFPVEGGLSSHFGKRGRRFHKGIDIAASVGTPIVSAGDGEVIFSGRQHGYGSTVVVDHGQFMTLYAHASKLIARTGDRVRKGDYIAKVGRTGNARGAHLHFELRDSNNRPIDPEPYLRHRAISQVKASTNKVAVSGPQKAPITKKSSKVVQRKLAPKKKGLLFVRD